MTNLDIIKANDDLRQHFKGGKVLIAHGPYDIDDRTLGRILCAVAKYNKFTPDSLHDEGHLLFAGYSLMWRIEIVDGERVMEVWANGDALHGC